MSSCRRSFMGGWFIQKVISRLPILSRVFPPGHFRFLALEGLYYKPGKEKYILTLIESLMKDMGINTAMTWLDRSSPVYDDLIRLGNGGIMRLAKKTLPVNIRMKFFNMTEQEQKVYFEQPSYISAFDMT